MFFWIQGILSNKELQIEKKNKTKIEKKDLKEGSI